MISDSSAKKVALALEQLGFKSGYGAASFKALQIGRGPFVHVYLGNGDRARMTTKALALRRALLKVFREFYNTPSQVLGARLILRSVGIYGDVLIVNQDSDIIDKCAPRAREAMLRLHKREFDRFRRFLHRKVGETPGADLTGVVDVIASPRRG